MSPLAAAALFAVGLVAIVLAFLLVTAYNGVVALRTRIDKAWGNVQVALEQRHDQLAQLVTAVRDVMAFEQTVLEEVARQRARYAPDAPIAEQGAVSKATSQAVRSLFAVVESYPQLRSQENVLRLQGEIERLEQQIADRRELYNDQVYRYNATIGQVPAVVLARLIGWLPRAFFDAEPGADVLPSVDLRGAAGPGSTGSTDPGSTGSTDPGSTGSTDPGSTGAGSGR